MRWRSRALCDARGNGPRITSWRSHCALLRLMYTLSPLARARARDKHERPHARTHTHTHTHARTHSHSWTRTHTHTHAHTHQPIRPQTRTRTRARAHAHERTVPRTCKRTDAHTHPPPRAQALAPRAHAPAFARARRHQVPTMGRRLERNGQHREPLVPREGQDRARGACVRRNPPKSHSTREAALWLRPPDGPTAHEHAQRDDGCDGRPCAGRALPSHSAR